MRCVGVVEQLDVTLVSLARAETGLRLRLGQALEVLGRGGHFELGFSSVAAYVLERCGRSVRWVEAARCLARRLEELPALRRAMAFGTISWSMGEALARVARPDDERSWIEIAQSRTVRQVRVLVKQAMSNAEAGGREEHAAAYGTADAVGGAFDEGGISDGDGSESCTLTCTVNQEDAWLFEATRTLLEHLGTYGSDAQLEALLAEGQGTLLAALPNGTLNIERLERLDRARQHWLSELNRWRAEAEALCEEQFRQSVPGTREAEPVAGAVAVAAALGLAALESASCHELDRVLRDLSRALARHELELSQLALRFHRADGWRQLGYATEAQYARERLGISRSSLVARRALALRLEKLPGVAEALGAGRLGVEAALQVVRVATQSTQAAWVERAQQRTVKHLREEVVAGRVAVRLSGEAECLPPTDAEMAAFHRLEQAVVSGRACQQRPANETRVAREAEVETAEPNGAEPVRHLAEPLHHLAEPGSEQRRSWLVMLASLASWLENGLQLSAVGKLAARGGGGSAGRITLRWQVSRAVHTWWRGLEAQAQRWLPGGTSWLGFLCLSLWQAWRHLLGADVAYGQIYIRDRHQCMSPVCTRRDVTPHHLKFRSAGGSDADGNVAAVCTWCHLFGVHGGRIRAEGSAERIHWELGARGYPCVVVNGRERVAA